MNFLVIGPGAMGCLFAARLKTAGHEGLPSGPILS